MVATLGVTELISWGVLFYAFSVLLVPMQHDLGWSRGFLSAGISVAVLISALAAPAVGWGLDRYGARWIMAGGSLVGAVTLLAWSAVDGRASYMAVFAVLGIALATTLYEPAFALAAAWFRRELSRALLVITVAGGLASTVFLPLTASLVAAVGWRAAIVWPAAILAAGTILPHALILRRRPDDLGLLPDGDLPATASHAAPLPDTSAATSRRPAPAARSHLDGITVREALRQPAFWWLLGGLSLSMLITGAVPVHLVAFLRDRHVDPGVAALIAGLQGALSIAGRFAVSLTTRLLPGSWNTAVLLGVQALSLAVLLIWDQTAGAVIFIVLYGATAGALTIVRASLIATFFGRRAYGSIAGIVALGTTLARSLGPLLVGLLYGTTQGYALPFWGLAATTGLAAGLMAVAARHRPTVGAIRTSTR